MYRNPKNQVSRMNSFSDNFIPGRVTSGFHIKPSVVITALELLSRTMRAGSRRSCFIICLSLLRVCKGNSKLGKEHRGPKR